MNNKKILILFLLGIILLGIFFRISMLNRDFAAEETDFVNPALAIKYTWHPIFYNSELYPNMVALLHPPMYIYTMAFVFLFKEGEIPARAINVLFVIFTAILIYFFCSKLIREEKGKIIGLISSAFFLINYYIFSSSILIDIDVLSAFFVFGFIYFVLRNYQTKKNSCLIWAGIFLFFSLANRYPMAILTYFGIGGYFYFNNELKPYFKNYFLMGIISGLSFLFIWTIYSTIIEPGNFFSFIIHNTKLGREQFENLFIYLGSFAINIAQIIRLFTFPAIILAGLTFFRLNKKSKLVKILLIHIIPILLLFILVPRPAFGYPRYFMTIFPAISVLIGIFIYTIFHEGINKKILFIGIFGFFSSLILLIFLNPQTTTYASNGLIKATNFPDFIFNISASLPLLIVFFFKKSERKKIFVILLITIALSYSLYFDVKLIQNEPHIKEIGEYLKEHTTENEKIIAPKAVGFYAERKFYLNDNNKPLLDFSSEHLKQYFVKSFNNNQMDDEFFWPEGFYGGLYPPYPEEKELKKSVYAVLYHPVKGYSPEAKIGNFYIYNLRQLTI